MTLPDPLRRHVLVVDDDDDVRAMTAEALRDRYEVATAATVRDGLRRAQEHVPAAVVLDVCLRDTSGWDLMRALQADARLRAVPIIVVSGAREADSPADVGPWAATLPKPCRMATLRELLERLLGS
jgi:DNA-binding response OmpR family regulator